MVAPRIRVWHSGGQAGLDVGWTTVSLCIRDISVLSCHSVHKYYLSTYYVPGRECFSPPQPRTGNEFAGLGWPPDTCYCVSAKPHLEEVWELRALDVLGCSFSLKLWLGKWQGRVVVLYIYFVLIIFSQSHFLKCSILKSLGFLGLRQKVPILTIIQDTVYFLFLYHCLHFFP